MIIISRSEALSKGLKRYFTGLSCKNGHIAERAVSNFTCLECQKERAQKDYQKDPDKWIRRRVSYYQNNKDIERQKMKSYYMDNAQRQSIIRKKRYYEDVEKNRSYSRDWSKKNKILRRISQTNRKKKILLATPNWFGELDLFVLSEAYLLADLRYKLTGIDWQVDHMVPINAKNVCGLHVWNNFQVIPAYLNNSKKNKLIFINPFEWIGAL